MKIGQFGPCGLYCGACGAEDCNGCRSDFIDDHVRTCEFRQCAKDKSIEACCFCADYPCLQLSDFMSDKWPHHWTMSANLQFIREHGIQIWLERQALEWSCSACGAHTHWYQKNCTCGEGLRVWELPV